MTSTAAILLAAERALDDLEAARHDLFQESVLSFSGGHYVGLIEQVDRFVSDVFVRLEQKAAATDDAALAQRLLRATERIEDGIRGLSPRQDEIDNAMTFVRETADDLERTAVVGGSLAAVGAVVAAGLYLAIVLR